MTTVTPGGARSAKTRGQRRHVTLEFVLEPGVRPPRLYAASAASAGVTGLLALRKTRTP